MYKLNRQVDPVDICDVIKQNESEFANIDLEKANTKETFLCFLLFAKPSTA